MDSRRRTHLANFLTIVDVLDMFSFQDHRRQRSMINQSLSKSPEVRAFGHYLRTGRRLSVGQLAAVSPIETKFNPYHDPKDGRFTFGPGGSGGGSDGVYRPDEGRARLILTGAPEEPPRRIGDNRPPEDPTLIDHVFPGLSNAPASAIIAVADPIFDLTGPGRAATTQWAFETSQALFQQIKAIDPGYHYDSLGFPSTLDGQLRMINALRWDRAAALYRVRGDPGLLQVETLRFLQDRTDVAYNDALAKAQAGTLPPAMTPRIAIGNYVDNIVKENLREQLNMSQISAGRGQTVRVNGREYDTSGDDLTYTIPDARVDDIAFDVTLWRKTPGSRQIRGFFRSDFKPRAILIIRPRQVDPRGSYLITSPRK
jgi:hypothetical protein